jgi:hypothetical protein
MAMGGRKAVGNDDDKRKKKSLDYKCTKVR